MYEPIMDRLFVSCLKNLEKLLKEELLELGIDSVQEAFAGVFVPRSIENVFLINYGSRIATRVLLPLMEFSCRDKEELYHCAKKIDWSVFLKGQKTFAIDANVHHHPTLRNSLFALQIVKDAICDQMRDKFQSRPNVNTYEPDVQINLFIHKQKAVISFDTSGLPLFKRGWRANSTTAPLQETLAAALIKVSGYQKEHILWDPFCGSATLLIEAAMIATNTPAGFFRKSFGFFHHPEFSEKKWLEIKEKLDSKKIPLTKGKIIGSDYDQGALDSGYKNLMKAGFDSTIDLIQRDIRKLRHPISPTLIITNPPYGKRLQISEDSIEGLGKWIKAFEQTKIKAFALFPSDFSSSNHCFSLKEILSFSNGGVPVSLNQIYFS